MPTIAITVTDEFKQQTKDKAKSLGLSVSEYARYVLAYMNEQEVNLKVDFEVGGI